MTTSTPAHATYAVLHNRNFLRMWIALLVSELGSALTQVTAFLLVYRLTNSVISVSLMMIAPIAASLVFGLVAGVAVDRSDRRRVMVAADLGRVLLVLAIPVLLPFGVAWLYILIAAMSMLSQFYYPAHSSVLPDIASDEDLGAANALMTASQFGAVAMGTLLAGYLAESYHIELAFYINAVTFLISAVLISGVRVPKQETLAHQHVSVVYDLKRGLSYIRKTPILRNLFLIFLPAGVALGFSDVLKLPFTLDVLGGTELQYGFLESVLLVGMVAASLLLSSQSHRLRDGQWITLSIIGVGMTSVAFAFARSVSMLVPISAAEGFLYAPSIIGASLVIQRAAPSALRGRVFAAFFVIRDSMFIVGMALAGLGDYFSLRTLYFLAGVVLLVAGAVSLLLVGLGRRSANRRASLLFLKDEPLLTGRPLLPTEIDKLFSLFPATATFSPSVLGSIATRARLVQLSAGEAIIRQDDHTDEAYFVLEGAVVAQRRESDDVRALEMLSTGDFFGEIAALTGAPRTADVVAVEGSCVVGVPAVVLRAMAEQPGFDELVGQVLDVRMNRLACYGVALPGRISYDLLV